MGYIVAGIDIHKKVLMVVAVDAAAEDLCFESFRCGTTAAEREQLVAWLQKRQVQEVVMESTAQYWKPVWMELEPHFVKGKLHLAQAHSNRAPKGRKHDFADARRLTRRLLAGELILSFVPDAEQRGWRTMTRARVQLVGDRVRLQNQLEALLEEMRIKLSSVVSELLGLRARRILRAMAQGESDPAKLAELGDFRLRCSPEQLAEALRGQVAPMHRQLLALFLERLDLLDRQIHSLETMAAGAMKPYEDAWIRLAGVAGFGARVCPTDPRRGRPRGTSVRLAGPVCFLGGLLSRQSGECRTKPQLPFAQGQSVRAPYPDPSRAGGGEEKRLFLAAHLSPLASQAGLPGSHLGRRSQTLPPGLESPP